MTRGVKTLQLSIFDRWGKLIFQSQSPEKGWDGTYNNDPCKQDVYVWKINLTTSAGIVKEYSGHVTLYR